MLKPKPKRNSDLRPEKRSTKNYNANDTANRNQSRVSTINNVNQNANGEGYGMSKRLEAGGSTGRYLTNAPQASLSNPNPEIVPQPKAMFAKKYKNGGTIGKNVKARESKPMLPEHKELTTDYGQGYVVTHPALDARTKEGVKKEAASYRKSTNNDPFIDTLEKRANTRNKMNNERDRKYVTKTIAPKYNKGTKGVNPLDNVDTSKYDKKKDKPVSQESLDNAPVDLPKKEDRSLDTLDTSAGDKFAVNKKIDRGFSEGNKIAKGGTTALAKYQKELKAAGYNIKVDGAWKDGGETDLAHRDYKAKQEAAKKKSSAKTEKKNGVEVPKDETKVTASEIGLDAPKSTTSKQGITYNADGTASRTVNGSVQKGKWENKDGKRVVNFKYTKPEPKVLTTSEEGITYSNDGTATRVVDGKTQRGKWTGDKDGNAVVNFKYTKPKERDSVGGVSVIKDGDDAGYGMVYKNGRPETESITKEIAAITAGRVGVDVAAGAAGRAMMKSPNGVVKGAGAVLTAAPAAYHAWESGKREYDETGSMSNALAAGATSGAASFLATATGNKVAGGVANASRKVSKSLVDPSAAMSTASKVSNQVANGGGITAKARIKGSSAGVTSKGKLNAGKESREHLEPIAPGNSGASTKAKSPSNSIAPATREAVLEGRKNTVNNIKARQQNMSTLTNKVVTPASPMKKKGGKNSKKKAA